MRVNLSADVLYTRLRRFGLEKDAVLPYKSADSTGLPYPQKMTLDKYLDILVRQGYLEKVSSKQFALTRSTNSAKLQLKAFKASSTNGVPERTPRWVKKPWPTLSLKCKRASAIFCSALS